MAKDTTLRKTTCLGCGFVLEKVASRYLFKKEWNANHLAYHTENYSRELNLKLLAEHNVKI